MFEQNILPNGNKHKLYLSTKLSYKDLVFVKQNGSFLSGFGIDFELRKNNNIEDRKTISKIVTTEEYETTISADYFAEAVVEFEIENGNYTIFPILSLKNADSIIKLDSIQVNYTNYAKERVYHPIVVEKAKEENSKNKVVFKLSNMRNSIPFAPQDYMLLVPIADTLGKKIIVKIEQNGKIIFEETAAKIFAGGLTITDNGNGLGAAVVNEDDSGSLGFLLIDGFSHMLNEGTVKIYINKNGAGIAEYNVEVVWFNKPLSLVNNEFAVELLDIIFDKDTINKFFKGKKKDSYVDLFAFWDAKLPNRHYVFNNLMNEFYKRADYAVNNFNSVNKRNGARSDRGITYIKYGKPDEIRRDYSGRNVIELWTYNNLNRQFVFRDNSGLGNYILEN